MSRPALIGTLCLWTILLGALAAAPASAQQAPAGAQVTIDDLRAPTAPAFVLLNVTPASIERPQNPKTLTLNVLDTVARANGIPQNYALEVAPYWLRSHPDLTFDAYQRPGVMQSILQSLSFSVATSPLLSTAATPEKVGTRVGVGLRTVIIGGTPNPRLEELVDSLHAINVTILEKFANKETIGEELRAEARKQALAIQALDHQRLGFLLTAAAGQVWSFPSDNFEQRRRDRWGAWLTPVYRFRACGDDASACTALLDVIGVVRALRDGGEKTRWDVGGRLLWQPVREFELSGEFLRRSGKTPTGRKSGNRTVGMLEYRINDDLSLFGSFGKDFKDDESHRTLVSIIGLNVGLGKKPAVKTSAKPAK